jgi:UDPglucose--hexose-1-phosphate uridylyltransferase
VRKTLTLLADGRELIYFDHDGRSPRTARDTRDLPPVANSSELRYDELLATWVTIASHRQERIYLPEPDACPFDPSRPGRPSEIPESDYDVVVFENRFPAFSGRGTPAPEVATAAARAPGHGRCEVICFTSDHTASFADLSLAQTRLVVEAWVDRSVALMALPEVVEVFCFENRGREIGVTETHPHGQIYAYPFVTARTATMLAAARRHNDEVGSNLFDDLLAREVRDGERIVRAARYWTAFVPFAARWPYEVHLYPNRRVAGLGDLTDPERDELCIVYLDLLTRFDALFDSPMPYIAAWHQAPAGEPDFALHLELFSIRRAPDKLKFLAGSESGMDAFISDVAPEAAARQLRGER